MNMTEADVEQAAIAYLADLGYGYVSGPDLAPGGASPERATYGDVILAGRLRAALGRLNPHLDADTLDGVAKRVLRPESVALLENNVAFQRDLTRGVEVQVRRSGQVRGDQAWLVDFVDPDKNDWLVVNQLTVVQGKHTRRLDLVVYVNGMPLAVIELKNPEDKNATIEGAWNQLQTYKAQIPSLFDTNELLIISDGTEARVGSLTAGFERFGPWRTVEGTALASDQSYRDLDLAIDFCEDVPALPDADIDRIVALFEAAGATAKVSSIHVNGWFGAFDKLTGCRHLVAERWGDDLDQQLDAYAYFGDSANDEPMFAAFPCAIGVANVERFLPRMKAWPAFITRGEGGHGFAQAIDHILALRG